MPASETTRAKPSKLSRQQYLDLYYYMRLNREVEETMTRLFRQNKIVGGLYSSLGQEGISVGSAYALEKKDWMAPMIRNIGASSSKAFLRETSSPSIWPNSLRPPKAKTAPAISAISKTFTSFRPFPCSAISFPS